jgi:hypothetical protein
MADSAATATYDQEEQDFDGNKAGFSNGGDNITPWKRQKYGRGDAGREKGKQGKQGRGKQGRGRNRNGRDGKGKGGGKGGGGRNGKKEAPLYRLRGPFGKGGSRIASRDASTCVDKDGGMEGESVWKTRRKTQNLDKRWHDGQVEAHQGHRLSTRTKTAQMRETKVR